MTAKKQERFGLTVSITAIPLRVPVPREERNIKNAEKTFPLKQEKEKSDAFL